VEKTKSRAEKQPRQGRSEYALERTLAQIELRLGRTEKKVTNLEKKVKKVEAERDEFKALNCEAVVTLSRIVAMKRKISSHCCPKAAINSDANLQAIGISSTCGSAVLSIASDSPNQTAVAGYELDTAPICTLVTPRPWPGAILKTCGTFSFYYRIAYLKYIN
jgi:hypothetical protein